LAAEFTFVAGQKRLTFVFHQTKMPRWQMAAGRTKNPATACLALGDEIARNGEVLGLIKEPVNVPDRPFFQIPPKVSLRRPTEAG
jgi:hypothetical protein